MDWGDPLTKEQKRFWASYYPELCKVSSYSFLRKIGSNTEATFSLVFFCDASPQVYTVALYLRVESADKVTCDLLFAKSRLRPKKKVSIPRMELLAVLIGTNAMKYAGVNLHVPISAKFLFSDSQCVLSWIRSTKKQQVFVQNRLNKIREQEGIRFRYVNTSDNPADLATRGKAVADLTAFWWNGPQWILKPPESWPCWDVEEINDESLKRSKTDGEPQVMYEVGLIVDQQPADTSFSLQLERYSTVSRLRRLTTWCLRFLNKLRKKSPYYGKTLDSSEIHTAMNLWEPYVQRTEYRDVISCIKTGKNHPTVTMLGLFLDAEEFIRCRGRIVNANVSEGTKFPKLIPCKHPYTRLVIKGYHARLCHAGVSQILAEIRLDYWIPRGRPSVKSAILKCPTCLHWESGLFKLPSIPPLPSSRVQQSAPFTYVGLDYHGPLQIKVNGQRENTWICIFTCLTVRAIHLEIVRDMTTDQFLMCLRRFVSRRGRPLEIILDNAAQFKLAKTVIAKLWQSCTTGSDVQNFSANNLIKWRFIVELAPWMGGFYERLISNVKRSLRKSIGYLCLTYDQLTTLLTEVESVVNRRPLVYVGDDIQSGKSLSPSDFLCLNPKHGFPDVSSKDFEDPNYLVKITKADSLLDLWKRGQQHLSAFWRSWSNNYLLSLRERYTSSIKQPRIVTSSGPFTGQVVLMKEDLIPRGSWKLVRIDKLNTGTDGNVRSALVRTSTGKTFTRSLSMLYPLEYDTTESPLIPEQTFTTSKAVDVVTDTGKHQRSAAKKAGESIKGYYAECDDDLE